MTLKKEIADKILEDEDLVKAIADKTGRKFRTVQQWCRDNDELLTMASSLFEIKTHFSLTDSEILLIQPEAKTLA